MIERALRLGRRDVAGYLIGQYLKGGDETCPKASERTEKKEEDQVKKVKKLREKERKESEVKINEWKKNKKCTKK